MKYGNYDEAEDLPYKVGCGGVVLRSGENGLEVLCLYRSKEKFGMKKGDSYHLPKGTLEENETLEQCALRETREESGAECEVLAYIGAANSPLGSKKMDYQISYVRHFFLMTCKTLHELHDKEHDSVDWLSVEEAKLKLAELPKDEEKILQNAVDFVVQNNIQL